MNHLDTILNQLEAKIVYSERVHQAVSKGNVGWHIEHALLTLNGVADFLIQSNPKNYKWTFNFIRLLVLTMNKIPRGRAKAPEVVLPKNNVNTDSLMAHLSSTRNKIKALESLSKDHYFSHPFFGDLKLNQTIRFLEIHTRHHLGIIEDIINARQQ